MFLLALAPIPGDFFSGGFGASVPVLSDAGDSMSRLSQGPAPQSLIATAARLRAEDGSMGCHQALRRAAERMGIHLSEANLAVDCERLEQETRQYQLLFRPEQASNLSRLRGEALSAMGFLEAFHPRIVGSVLSGTADLGATVTLHVFSDAPEDVMLHLMHYNVPFSESERNYRYGSGRNRRAPVFSFEANGVPFDVVVFPVQGQREAPVSAGRPMQRASDQQLRALMTEAD